MSGDGSMRWTGRERKCTVEECLVLPVNEVTGYEGIREGLGYDGELHWKSFLGAERGSVGFYVHPRSGGKSGRMRLKYVREDTGPLAREPRRKSFDYWIELETTPCHFGGRRWWFQCPLPKEDGGRCERRSFKLYLPPGGGYFGCRECYDLTYRSAQEAHAFDSVYSRLLRSGGS